MSSVEQGPLLAYNSLKDSHLENYFAKPRHRQHLKKAGLVRQNGDILSEAEIYEGSLRKDQRRRTQEAILKSLEWRRDDLERNHHALCMRTLDEIEKIERVRRIRSGKRNGTGEDMIDCCIVPSSICHRPVSAFMPDTKSCLLMSSMRNKQSRQAHSAGWHQGSCSPEDDQDDPDDAVVIQRRSGNQGNSFSPYLQPLRPLDLQRTGTRTHSGKKPGSRRKLHQINKTGRNRRKYLPSMAQDVNEDGRFVMLTMKYFGEGVCLDNDQADPYHEVLVEQQHCGGNTLYVFKDKILPGTEFSFPSYRHPGYPFSLSIYVNGRYDSRLSTCCEYKHRLNARLGGKCGRFAIVGVKGGRPCCRCLVKHLSKKKKRSLRTYDKDFDSPVEEEDDSGGEETAMSLYNPGDKSRVQVPVIDDEDDKEFRNFDKRTAELQSPDSMRRGSSARKQKPKANGNKENEKDQYSHVLYDIKVPVDDDDDDDEADKHCGNTTRTVTKKSEQRQPENKRQAYSKRSSLSTRTRTEDSSSSESSSDSKDSEDVEELEKVKPKSLRSRRDSSEDESDSGS